LAEYTHASYLLPGDRYSPRGPRADRGARARRPRSAHPRVACLTASRRYVRPRARGLALGGTPGEPRPCDGGAKCHRALGGQSRSTSRDHRRRCYRRGARGHKRVRSERSGCEPVSALRFSRVRRRVRHGLVWTCVQRWPHRRRGGRSHRGGAGVCREDGTVGRGAARSGSAAHAPSARCWPGALACVLNTVPRSPLADAWTRPWPHELSVVGVQRDRDALAADSRAPYRRNAIRQESLWPLARRRSVTERTVGLVKRNGAG
jgi:hypothetical protein